MGVGKYKTRGVEEVSIERDGGWRLANVVWRSIEAVAHNRVSESVEMNADLVCAARLDSNLDQSEVAVER